MSKLVDIENEEFWQILFDEACVEGEQAKRIENELNKICVSRQKIENSIIDEFVDNAWGFLGAEDKDIYARESIIEIATQMKGGMK